MQAEEEDFTAAEAPAEDFVAVGASAEDFVAVGASAEDFAVDTAAIGAADFVDTDTVTAGVCTAATATGLAGV